MNHKVSRDRKGSDGAGRGGWARGVRRASCLRDTHQSRQRGEAVSQVLLWTASFHENDILIESESPFTGKEAVGVQEETVGSEGDHLGTVAWQINLKASLWLHQYYIRFMVL